MKKGLLYALLVLLTTLPDAALAHAVGGADAAFVRAQIGPAPFPFLYLGAKHMVTGYDHLLFLLGVVFYLKRFRDIAILVSLFSLGHSLTLLFGVLTHTGVNPFLLDAVIGLSVLYKGLDNLGAVKAFFGRQPDNRLVVFGFGLFHGLGLAASVEKLRPHADGLIINLLSFNIGVELGQLLALSLVLAVLTTWRSLGSDRMSGWINGALCVCGLVLTGAQLTGYFSGS